MPRWIPIFGVGALTLVALLACKQLSKNKKVEDVPPGASAGSGSSPTSIGRLPQRISSQGEGSDDGNAVNAAPALAVEVDQRTGRLKSHLVLRLDHFPEARPGQTTLPVCYDPFPSYFELGSLECVGKVEDPRPLLAKHVAQECYTKAAAAQGVPDRTEAAEGLELTGCSMVKVRLHVFDPPLRIDAEIRD